MGCDLNFGTQSCPIELEVEEDEGKGTGDRTKVMDGLKPSQPESDMKDSHSLPLPTSLELIPYKKSSPPHPSGSQESTNPEPVSPSIQDMGRLRNAESGNESPGFAEGSVSLDAPSRSPGATRSFKRLIKAHKVEHNNVVSSQKTELEREMELFEAAEREEEARLLTSLRHNPSNECSTSPKSSNSEESIQMDWKRGLRGTIGEQPRPKRGQKPGPNHQAHVKEEDVCFACFDGGKLILCDKRPCPKVYHVACTGRKSDFFRKKGQWYCGWHFCATCARSAKVHCYMCPNAYCSGCITEAEFLHIRKGRGLCDFCYSIVYMIEHNLSINSEGVEVDFDDEETYECLFKHYWKDLKKKISLSWSEINNAYRAKDESHGKGGHEEKQTDKGDRASTESDFRPVTRQSHGFKRKRGAKNSPAENASCSEYEEEEEEDEEEKEVEEEELEEEEEEEEESLNKPKRGRPKGRKFTGWASNELVDFLHSIKEDSTKPLTLILVNKLLLQYVEANKLSSRQRGQIICDERLRKLFGRKNVGKFQMMKLLTKHIASKQTASFKGWCNTSNYQDNVEVGEVNDKGQKQRKLRRKTDDVRQVQPDASSYASIDMKNMSLIYLKRSLLEDLRGDPNFESKVTGAFVRIRVPSMVNKNDTCYRLVQIVGIKQAANCRNNGKAPGVMLEILNLHRREEITVDLVSSQDFTEEECHRLRQSFKCGLLKAITVGELQEKARVLHEAKVKDWFDTELLRLSHLRDRASEKGHRRELRECVERLQLLGSPSERERQLRAPIEVTSDPCMDPGYESDNGGPSMQKPQGNEITTARRQWERSSLPVKHHNNLDKGGWCKVVSHAGNQAGGNKKDFEKDHRGDISGKSSQGWGHASCDGNSAGFKVGRKDAVDNNVIGLNTNGKGDGWWEELHDNGDIGRTASVDARKSDGWAVEAGSKKNCGWEANVGGNTKTEKWPGTSTVEDGWGEPESIGKRDAPGENSWEQNMKNCETADVVKEDSGWGVNGEKNRGDDGWEDKTVDIKRNYDGWEPLEGGDGKSLGWGGTAGDNSKDDGWGDIAGDNSKDDGWGGNAGGKSKDDGWGGMAGGNSKDDGWGGKAGAHGKDDDWKGNTRTGGREDGGWGGNMRSHSKDDGWESNASAHKKDGGWGGNTRSDSKEDGWGGNASAHKKDCGWGGNTYSRSKDDGWGNNPHDHKKDGGWGGHAGAQSHDDDGWGDDAGTDSRNGGWGYRAGSSEKDLEQGYGKGKGADGGWGNMGGSRRELDCGDHAKGVERNSSWRNRSDRREGFSGADTRPPHRNRREGFSDSDTRPPYRDNKSFGKISEPTNHLPAQARGVMPDVSTRTGVDGGGLTRNNEKEKIWYYQDPSKNIQGPFSLEQLRKWERTKLFPLDLKVWRATDGQDGSILLTDALLGRFGNDLPPGFGHRLQNSQGLGAPEGMKNTPVSRRPGSDCQDNGPMLKWDQDNFRGNDGVLDKWRHSSHGRPWELSGLDRLPPQDSGRDGARGHWDGGANHRDYSEHHNPHRPRNDGRFSIPKKDFPCKYFARGGCKKGDECDFRH